MKRLQGVTLADWLESVVLAEDLAIRKREGLPVTSTGYDWHAATNAQQRHSADAKTGMVTPQYLAEKRTS